jgi:DnaJ domain
MMTNFYQYSTCAKVVVFLVTVIIFSVVSLNPFHGSNTWMVYAQSETTAPSLENDNPVVEDSASTGSSPSLMEDQTPPTTPTTTTSTTTDSFNVKEHFDWGSYYDPQNIFCGKYDCYRILGFDYESFGTQKPDTKIITKRYRALSREWHPDKSKQKNAKERFVVRFTISVRMLMSAVFCVCMSI